MLECSTFELKNIYLAAWSGCLSDKIQTSKPWNQKYFSYQVQMWLSWLKTIIHTFNTCPHVPRIVILPPGEHKSEQTESSHSNNGPAAPIQNPPDSQSTNDTSAEPVEQDADDEAADDTDDTRCDCLKPSSSGCGRNDGNVLWIRVCWVKAGWYLKAADFGECSTKMYPGQFRPENVSKCFLNLTLTVRERRSLTVRAVQHLGQGKWTGIWP